MDDAPRARALWRVFEPYHAVVYFAPDVKSAFEDLGLPGFWRGYFASRAAPMGPVPAEVAIATFYNFHPAMVRRAMSETWARAAPAAVTAARVRLADREITGRFDALDDAGALVLIGPDGGKVVVAAGDVVSFEGSR